MSNVVYIDSEFIEDGTTIEIISLALVRPNKEYLYLANADCDLSRANPWVKENVIPKLGPLPVQPRYTEHARQIVTTASVSPVALPVWCTRQEMRHLVKEFSGENPEFWGYFADYDWVAVCQLFGTMMDLPKGWPFFCMDLKQSLVEARLDRQQPEDSNAHCALQDALWIRQAHQELAELRGTAEFRFLWISGQSRLKPQQGDAE